MTEGNHQLLSLPPRTVMTLSDEGMGKACSKRNLIEESIAESIFEGQVIYVDIILVCLNIGKNHIFDYFTYFIML